MQGEGLLRKLPRELNWECPLDKGKKKEGTAYASPDRREKNRYRVLKRGVDFSVQEEEGKAPGRFPPKGEERKKI